MYNNNLVAYCGVGVSCKLLEFTISDRTCFPSSNVVTQSQIWVHFIVSIMIFFTSSAKLLHGAIDKKKNRKKKPL